MEKEITVAENATERFVCKVADIEYLPETMRHKYGHSSRKPLEDLFLGQLNFFKDKYPDHRIFTLGSSLVFGEKFPTFLSVCEMQITGLDAFSHLVHGLKHSDLAIRRKLSPLWDWKMAGIKDCHAVLVVGWLDFAYFIQHRKDFIDVLHQKYMKPFIDPDKEIISADYKILHNGDIVLFDETKLNNEELRIYNNPSLVQYERVGIETFA